MLHSDLCSILDMTATFAFENCKIFFQWKTTPQAAPQVQSFAEIQKAESEEMQRLNKIRAQEIEKQKANQINNKSQVNLALLIG